MADAPQAPRATPVRERGYAIPPQAAGSTFLDLTEELTPELVWPLSVSVFDKMRKQDAQVSSVLRAVTSPIIRTRWMLDGTGCREEVVRFVADNLGLPIRDDDKPDDSKAKLRGRARFSWDAHVRLALLMLPFGHSFFEQLYFPPDENNKYYLRKLGPRLPATISEVKVARDGGLEWIKQWGTLGQPTPGPAMPVNRLVAYVNEREGGNWLGLSILRSCYKNWLLKDRALRTWSLSVDRNGVGVPMYTAAETEESLDAGIVLATRVRSGDNSGGAMPNGAKMDLKGVDGTLPDINEYVRYQDEQIGRSALGHFLNLGSQVGGQVGSYNLGSVLQGSFNLALDTVASNLADTASAHIVEDLVDLNYGSTEPAPILVYDEVGTQLSELDRLREVAGLESDLKLAEFIRTAPAITQGVPAA